MNQLKAGGTQEVRPPVVLERPVGLGPMSVQAVSRALHMPVGFSGPSKVRSAAKKAFERL
jgi:hypothetical protein